MTSPRIAVIRMDRSLVNRDFSRCEKLETGDDLSTAVYLRSFNLVLRWLTGQYPYEPENPLGWRCIDVRPLFQGLWRVPDGLLFVGVRRDLVRSKTVYYEIDRPITEQFLRAALISEDLIREFVYAESPRPSDAVAPPRGDIATTGATPASESVNSDKAAPRKSSKKKSSKAVSPPVRPRRR